MTCTLANVRRVWCKGFYFFPTTRKKIYSFIARNCVSRAQLISTWPCMFGGILACGCSIKRAHCQVSGTAFTLDTLLHQELTALHKLKLIGRLSYLIILFTPAALIQLVNLIFRSKFLFSFQLKLTLIAIKLAGPAFIKLGQWASTRRDLFPEQLCDILSTLQTRCPPHSWQETEKRLRESFGETWRELFDSIDPSPIGSGCVAQVYKWSLKRETVSGSMQDDSDKSISVAVKVLHPGIVESVRRDVQLLRLVAGWIDYWYPPVYWISLRESTEEFAAIMGKQLDLTVEANNLVRFRANFKNQSQVKFPTPLYPLVTESVLVETYEEGVPINDILSAPSCSLHKKLAHNGISLMLSMIFHHNFVHGDLHPGNILVQEGDQGSSLVVLDCGIVTELSEVDRRNFRELFIAIVQNDGHRVADLMLTRAQHSNCVDPDAYREQMSCIVSSAVQNLSLKEVDVGALLSAVFRVLIKHQVKLEPQFASVMIAIMVLEGLGRSLDPSLDILHAAKPYILQETRKVVLEHVI